MTTDTAAGRSVTAGAAYIPLAKLWFVLAAFTMNFVLPNLLPADAVGDFGVVNRLVSLVNMVVITATIQAVSKFVSEDRSKVGAVQRSALRLQTMFAGSLSLALFLLADVAAGAFRDPSLAPLIRITAPIPLFYGFYAVFIGCLNGTSRFRLQAVFDMSYATVRTSGIVGAALLGLGVAGCLGAFAGAAGVVAAVAAVVVLRRPGEAVLESRPLATFALPIIGVVLFSNAMLSADLFLVKALASPDESKVLSGCYFALLNLAIVPYMLLVSINFILFPLVSRATFREDRDRTCRYIGTSLRAAVLLAACAEMLIAAAPDTFIRIIYPSKPEYVEFAPVLAVLAVGYAALSVLSVMTTIVNASGRPGRSLQASAFAVAVQCAVGAFAIPRFGLIGGAIGSGIAFASTSLLLGLDLRARFGSVMAPATVIRAIVAVACGLGCAALVQAAGLPGLVRVPVALVAYAASLIVTRELRRDDVRALRSLL